MFVSLIVVCLLVVVFIDRPVKPGAWKMELFSSSVSDVVRLTGVIFASYSLGYCPFLWRISISNDRQKVALAFWQCKRNVYAAHIFLLLCILRYN